MPSVDRRVGWLCLVLALAATADAATRQVAKGRTLLARVVDGSGRPQVDLGLDDFVVSEAGDAREVLDVHVADYPLALLVDDTTAQDALSSMKAAVARFIGRVGERPVAVGTLARPSSAVASFSSSRAEVLAAVSAISPSDAPAQPLPALAHLSRLIIETGSSFSTIVIVSGRAIDANREVDGQLLPSILESGAIVHVVGSRNTEASRLDDTPDLLKVLADQTRGQYTTIYTTASFAIALDRLADLLSTELMVEYLVPPDGVSGDVRIGVRRPGSQVVGLGVK